jgi:hypothetical protein
MTLLVQNAGHPTRFLLAALALGLGLALPARAKAPTKPNEIIVSAANYAEASPEVLSKLFRRPADLVEVPPPPAGESLERYYQFLPGETLATDLSYLEVCKLLVPALAAKNFHNTSDQAKVGYILRVTFGERPWRDPFVRKDYLEWSNGLVPKRHGASLDAAGAWDDRAGGDESNLYQLERDLGVEGMADRLIGGMVTQDYHLIVVDAFEVATLRQLGNKTPRAWTTFIAVPRQKGVKFSDVAAKMIEKAAPYFGETLPGKARFTDREGTVKLGELQVLEENVPPPPSKK